MNSHHQYSGSRLLISMKASNALQDGPSSPKNAKYRVAQSQVCTLHTTHLGPLKSTTALTQVFLERGTLMIQKNKNKNKKQKTKSNNNNNKNTRTNDVPTHPFSRN